MEFFNTYHIKEETIYARLGKKTITFDCICVQNIQQRLKKKNKVNKQIVIIVLQCIALLGA